MPLDTPVLPPIRSPLVDLDGPQNGDSNGNGNGNQTDQKLNQAKRTMTRDWYLYQRQLQTVIGDLLQAWANGGFQTPWLQDEDAAGHSLYNLDHLEGNSARIAATVISAIGKGTGDETAKVQALLDAVPSIGGVVRLSGPFNVKGTLTPKPNTVIDGGGLASITQTKALTPLFSLDTVDHVTIRGCNLIGFGAADYNDSHNTTSRIIDISNSTDIRIENNTISNYGHSGVAFSATKRLWIVNNIIIGLPSPTIAPQGNYNFGIVGFD